MNSRPGSLASKIVRYALVGCAIAGVTAVERGLAVNSTTVALMFLIGVLLVSAFWGMPYSIVFAVLAAACFNFFFLPPVGTFVISEVHNWIALLAFLFTAIVAGNLAERARREADAATRRRQEVERLYKLSQRLLAGDSLPELLRAVPRHISEAFGATAVALLIGDSGECYRSPAEGGAEADQLRQTLVRREAFSAGGTDFVPLLLQSKPAGALAISGGALTRETLEAVGGLIGIAIERTHALEQVAENRAVQENERLRMALLDAVAHQFRTPLTGIKASATSLLSEYELSSEQRRELLTVIDEEADRLNRLVEEAAEIGQIHAGLLKLELRPTAVRDPVNAALLDLSTELAGRSVHVDMAETLPPVAMDGERIREVLRHLLQNAAKFSPPRSPIRVSAEVAGDFLEIQVVDQGRGIDVAEQQQVFASFYRGRDSGNVPGTGMGLAIARTLIEAHGGSIGVRNQPGQGAAFTVRLPAGGNR